MEHFYAIFLSFIAGTAYYMNMSLSIPKDSNCSFSANIWTDIGAFIAGIFIVYKGIVYADPPLTFVGTTIIVEHIWQLFHNKI